MRLNQLHNLAGDAKKCSNESPPLLPNSLVKHPAKLPLCYVVRDY